MRVVALPCGETIERRSELEAREIEDIREFFMRRPWLAGERSGGVLVTDDEYAKLKGRQPVELPAERVSHLRSFIQGWLAAKR